MYGTCSQSCDLFGFLPVNTQTLFFFFMEDSSPCVGRWAQVDEVRSTGVSFDFTPQTRDLILTESEDA